MNWFAILFFIISVILLVITKYYVLNEKVKLDNIESFLNEETLSSSDKLLRDWQLKPTFLSANNAKKLFKKSNQYLQNMNQPNINARKCLTLSDLYDKYMDGLIDITDEEKNIVNDFLLNLLEKVKKYDVNFSRYIAYWLRYISFAKGKEWLESGMPHTLDNVVIMDIEWFMNPRDTTLLHELTHIHQRNFFYEFEDLYFELGYVYYPKLIKGLEPYYKLNRNNPDGASVFWLWHYPNSKIINTNNNIDSNNFTGIIPNDTNNNDYWWIGAVFRSANPVSVTDVNYIALKLDRASDGIFYFFNKQPTPLSKFNIYNKYMGISDNNYHPNETTAKYMEWYYLDKLNSNNKSDFSNYEGFKTYKNYFDNLIKKYYSK